MEQEKNFLDRIKSKTKILQMYSSGPSNDLFYLGDSFDNSDYIDFSKAENKDKLPLVDNGRITLGIKNTTRWMPRNVIIGEESNGFFGTNHSAYVDAQSDIGYKYHFVDNPTSRNPNNINDGNPLTFFEYEQINISQKTTSSKDFEYKYIVNSGSDVPETYVDWSKFSSDPLKLNITLESETAQMANYIKVVPYFGTTDSISRDVIVKKIEIVNDSDQIENILPRQIYISSTFIPSSTDSPKDFFYREAKINFSERKVKRINIYFEQVQYSEIKLKHAYFKPDPTLSLNTPYANQQRFSPEEATITSSMSYRQIPWSSIVYNVSELIPQINQPNLFKSEVYNTKSIDVSLSRNIPVRTGFCVKVRGLDGSFYRITNRFFDDFNNETERLPGYSSITDKNYIEFVSKANVTSNGGYLDPYLSSINSSDLGPSASTGATKLSEDIDAVVNWFNTNNSDDTSTKKFEKLKLDPTFPAVKEETNSFDTKVENKKFRLQLVREFEVLNAQRRNISLRDISVGYESYVDSAEIVSRKYDLPSEIEYMTMSSEIDFSGKFAGSSNEYVKYYISVDDGIKWIPISSIENPFSNIPEVIAFNVNIDKNFKIPGVSYFSQPDIPASVKGFLIKIELTRPVGENITPIIYSYKVGAKVRQL